MMIELEELEVQQSEQAQHGTPNRQTAVISRAGSKKHRIALHTQDILGR